MTLDDGTGQVETRQWLDGSTNMDLDQLMEKQGIQYAYPHAGLDSHLV